MTRAEFLSAANKGQGRALAAVRSGDYSPSLHDLRRLVLRWPGFEPWTEQKRGWYTAELLAASVYEEELTDLVIRHLARTKGAWKHLSHRKSIVLELAKRGGEAARSALYAHFDPHDDFCFAHEILELDGLAGLAWLISHLDGRLVDDSSWTFKWWLEDLSEGCGEDVVSGWLSSESLVCPAVAEFARLAAVEPGELQRETEPPLSYEAFREQWDNPGSVRPLTWALQAAPDELAKAWRMFESDHDPDILHRLGKALRSKTEHCDLDRVILRARNWQDDWNPFADVIEEVIDPQVRQLGLDFIDTGRADYGIGLVVTNAVPGDEPRLLTAATGLTNEEDIHGAGLDLLRLEEGFDIREAMLWVCEHTPCSFCRESAFSKLVELGQAPVALVAECLLDCVSETRDAAEGVVRGRSN